MNANDITYMNECYASFYLNQKYIAVINSYKKMSGEIKEFQSSNESLSREVSKTNQFFRN